MKYRKKPVVIEAFQITEVTRNSNCDWARLDASCLAKGCEGNWFIISL
jgi:hypothetical protein